MFCDFCGITYSVQTTIRLTPDGHEILVEYCGHCMRKSETEFVKGPSTRINVDMAKRPAKRT